MRWIAKLNFMIIFSYVFELDSRSNSIAFPLKFIVIFAINIHREVFVALSQDIGE